MAKKKSPAELETHVVRIHNGDFALLFELSQRMDVSIGDALSRLIRDKLEEKTKPESRSQAALFPIEVKRTDLFTLPRTTTISVERRIKND